jgi:potassium channel subfamily K, other eukaryote
MAASVVHHAFTLHDPSSELPEDSIGFRFEEDGVHLHDGENGEHVGVWAWERLLGAEGLRDSEDPTDMELVSVEVDGLGTVQVECNDASALARLFNGHAADGAAGGVGGGTADAEGGVRQDALRLPVAADGRTSPAPRSRRGSGRSAAQASSFQENMENDGAGGAGGMPQRMGKPILSVFGPQGPLRSMALVLSFFIVSVAAYCVSLPERRAVHGGGSVDPAHVEGFVAGAGRASQQQQQQQQRWTVVDALYFGVTTITTVGYGDLHPRTSAGRAFTCFFVFYGVFGVGMALGAVAQFFVERAEEQRERAMAEIARNTKVKTSALGRVVVPSVSPATLARLRKARKARAALSRHTRMLRQCLGLRKRQMELCFSYARAACPLLVAALLGLLLAPIEGWSLGEAAYVSCVTLTSVGFGDISPATQAGRLYSVFYIPCGISILFGVMGKIVEIRMLAQKNRVTSIKEILKMDKDGDGEVNLVEFQLFMLKNMGKITSTDLSLLQHQFSILDKSGDGLLSAEDIDEESEKACAAAGKMACTTRKIQV